MARKDFWYNKAKQEGYRTRAAYKLIQIDELENVFSRGDTVVDLGAAPGGWIEVAAAAVGEDGLVIGVDRQRIRDVDDLEAPVETIRGDITDETTHDRLQRLLDGRSVDVILSDMAPDMTGEYSLDQARSLHLASIAFEFAQAFLAPGGHFVTKIFEGDGVNELRADLEEAFEYVRATSPEASRDASSELYLVGKRYVDPPVSVGDELTVRIETIGEEGDGIASVEGYRLFVPDVEQGAEVEVVVEDVKSSFGFARSRE